MEAELDELERRGDVDEDLESDPSPDDEYGLTEHWKWDEENTLDDTQDDTDTEIEADRSRYIIDREKWLKQAIEPMQKRTGENPAELLRSLLDDDEEEHLETGIEIKKIERKINKNGEIPGEDDRETGQKLAKTSIKHRRAKTQPQKVYGSLKKKSNENETKIEKNLEMLQKAINEQGKKVILTRAKADKLCRAASQPNLYKGTGSGPESGKDAADGADVSADGQNDRDDRDGEHAQSEQDAQKQRQKQDDHENGHQSDEAPRHEQVQALAQFGSTGIEQPADEQQHGDQQSAEKTEHDGEEVRSDLKMKEKQETKLETTGKISIKMGNEHPEKGGEVKKSVPKNIQIQTKNE